MKTDFVIKSDLDCSTTTDSVVDFLSQHTSSLEISEFDVCSLEDEAYTALKHRVCRDWEGGRHLETENDDEPSEMFKYVIYGILIICVLGFAYFIINWIRCVMSRPKDLDDSSDDEEVYDPSKRSQNMKKMEMKNVLP